MKKRIVVAEDDPGIQDIFKILLQDKYEVDIVKDERDIINSKTVIPDLYLLDRQLPKIDGLDICRHIKSQNSTANIPVIMISANPNIVKMASEAGADDIIEKPFNIQHLLYVISKHISASDHPKKVPQVFKAE